MIDNKSRRSLCPETVIHKKSGCHAQTKYWEYFSHFLPGCTPEAVSSGGGTGLRWTSVSADVVESPHSTHPPLKESLIIWFQATLLCQLIGWRNEGEAGNTWFFAQSFYYNYHTPETIVAGGAHVLDGEHLHPGVVLQHLHEVLNQMVIAPLVYPALILAHSLRTSSGSNSAHQFIWPRF